LFDGLVFKTKILVKSLFQRRQSGVEPLEHLALFAHVTIECWS